MLTLAWPWVLLALPLPRLVMGLPRAREEESAALRVPAELLASAAPNAGCAVSRARPSPRLWLALLTWALLVVAAARPEWVGDPINLPIAGRDILLAIDISGSMEQADFELNGRPVSRIALVKAVAARFIERREHDRMGLILFGSRAHLLTPLTFDRDTVASMLSEAVVGLAGRETAIGDAIALAVKRLRDEPEDNRVLILLTDGANNAGHIEPLAAAQLAADAGVRIYTIGMGNGALAGRWGPARADFDPESLERIAELTGGRFFAAQARGELEQIYTELDRLEPSERTDRAVRPRRALYVWPAAAAVLLTFGLAASPWWSGWRGGLRRVAG
ncbi:BatB protein [Thiocapsa imhoffii]|uniref:BatB protein n=1 Tax=Thiocapsa imhoffii TaxID=382777 RepID=A0A9X0WHK2_9GAMM|nr:VWA domain-containing protein [Thiocapsa imhoffii]MBK1644650.1 BatB protein [Thiocapsa imhoffii]